MGIGFCGFARLKELRVDDVVTATNYVNVLIISLNDTQEWLFLK